MAIAASTSMKDTTINEMLYRDSKADRLRRNKTIKDAFKEREQKREAEREKEKPLMPIADSGLPMQQLMLHHVREVFVPGRFYSVPADLSNEPMPSLSSTLTSYISSSSSKDDIEMSFDEVSEMVPRSETRVVQAPTPARLIFQVCHKQPHGQKRPHSERDSLLATDLVVRPYEVTFDDGDGVVSILSKKGNLSVARWFSDPNLDIERALSEIKEWYTCTTTSCAVDLGLPPQCLKDDWEKCHILVQEMAEARAVASDSCFHVREDFEGIAETLHDEGYLGFGRSYYLTSETLARHIEMQHKLHRPMSVFAFRSHIPLADATLLEMIYSLRDEGWEMKVWDGASVTVNMRKESPAFNVDAGAPKVWHLLRGKMPSEAYLLALLSGSDLQSSGTLSIHHWQVLTYYEALMAKKGELQPDQPATFYRALLDRRKRKAPKNTEMLALEFDDLGHEPPPIDNDLDEGESADGDQPKAVDDGANEADVTTDSVEGKGADGDQPKAVDDGAGEADDPVDSVGSDDYVSLADLSPCSVEVRDEYENEEYESEAEAFGEDAESDLNSEESAEDDYGSQDSVPPAPPRALPEPSAPRAAPAPVRVFRRPRHSHPLSFYHGPFYIAFRDDPSRGGHPAFVANCPFHDSCSREMRTNQPDIDTVKLRLRRWCNAVFDEGAYTKKSHHDFIPGYHDLPSEADLIAVCTAATST